MDAHKDSLALDLIGPNAFVAGLFGCTSQYVSKWRRHGIPRAHRMYLQLRFPDAFVGVDAPPVVSDNSANMQMAA